MATKTEDVSTVSTVKAAGLLRGDQVKGIADSIIENLPKQISWAPGHELSSVYAVSHPNSKLEIRAGYKSTHNMRLISPTYAPFMGGIVLVRNMVVRDRAIKLAEIESGEHGVKIILFKDKRRWWGNSQEAIFRSLLQEQTEVLAKNIPNAGIQQGIAFGVQENDFF